MIESGEHNLVSEKKNTAQPISIVRRVQDYMGSSGDRIIMLFLDWEKAFDKIDHEELIKAIERFNIPEKIVRIIKAFYDNPKFFIEDNMGSSKEKKNKTPGSDRGAPSHFTCLC